MVQADDGYDSDEYAITNEIVIIEEHQIASQQE